MAIHVLDRQQCTHASLEECWRFFSDPKNLAAITPPSLDFQVMSCGLPEEIHAGMMIRYRVRPLLGMALTWLTEITHVEAPRYFVDEQRAGPYRLWHHEHSFRELGDGQVEIRDRVHYVVPFGWAVPVVHSWLVRPRLEAIFGFRERAVAERFGEVSQQAI
jgi:ligand-binding SRPBCC domain-containing protein